MYEDWKKMQTSVDLFLQLQLQDITKLNWSIIFLVHTY